MLPGLVAVFALVLMALFPASLPPAWRFQPTISAFEGFNFSAPVIARSAPSFFSPAVVVARASQPSFDKLIGCHVDRSSCSHAVLDPHGPVQRLLSDSRPGMVHAMLCWPTDMFPVTLRIKSWVLDTFAMALDGITESSSSLSMHPVATLLLLAVVIVQLVMITRMARKVKQLERDAGQMHQAHSHAPSPSALTNHVVFVSNIGHAPRPAVAHHKRCNSTRRIRGV